MFPRYYRRNAGPRLQWTISASSIKSQQTPPTCLAAATSTVVPFTTVTTANCSATDPAQTLAYSAATGLIVHTPSGLCVDGGSPIPPFCGLPEHASWTFCK